MGETYYLRKTEILINQQCTRIFVTLIEGIDAFDLEGTLALISHGKYKYPSVWPMIAEALGPECKAEEDRLVDLWDKERKKPVQTKTYAMFVEESIRNHQKYGLTKELFDKTLNQIPWINGISETFKTLKEKNRLIVIITGGFANHAERMPGREYIDYIKGACTYFFSTKGNIERYDCKEYDWQGKVAVIEEICNRHGLDVKKHTTYTGDGKNDPPIAQAVGISIALNACPELQKVATHSINTATLTDILPYLMRKKEPNK